MPNPPKEKDLKRVLVGKAIVKAGADRKTLRMLDEVFQRLEMDRKALTLATSLPPIFWEGITAEGETAPDASEPERPMILFSVLKRMGSQADVRQVAQAWQEQVQGKTAERLVLPGSMESTPTLPERMMQLLHIRRPSMTPLEMFLVMIVIVQMAACGAWLIWKPGRINAPTPKIALLPIPSPAPAIPAAVPAVPAVVPAAAKPIPPPAVKFEDFVYFSDGRIQLRWTAAGKNQRYQVYVSKDKQLKSALPFGSATHETQVVLKKSTAYDWITVRSVGATGREGRFAEPVFIGLY